MNLFARLLDVHKKIVHKLHTSIDKEIFESTILLLIDGKIEKGSALTALPFSVPTSRTNIRNVHRSITQLRGTYRQNKQKII